MIRPHQAKEFSGIALSKHSEVKKLAIVVDRVCADVID
jgi:hypothetical protein